MTLAVLVSCFQLSAQIDRSKAPEPGPAPKIEFGSHEKFTLRNGLRVIVVEDHSRPVVTASLSFLTDPFEEGEKAGLSSIFGDLWGKGTENLTAEEIHEKTDFLGATFRTGANSIGFYTMTKYLDEMMGLMSDVLFHPTFPENELEKIKTQIYSGLEASKTDPSSILSNIRTATVYPEGHAYSDILTAETVAAVTADDCRAFYSRYIIPNNAILVFVGDITLKQAKKLSNAYLKSWKKGEIVRFENPEVNRPEGIQVIFSPKAGSVQSSIQMMYPVDLKPGAPDILAANLANAIYGGGDFSAKLMKNLREDKGYTYGAYSSISSDRVSGSFRAQAEVNREATDSSFIEMQHEMFEMLAGNFTDKDFERIRTTFAGSFSRSLEETSTLADFALNTERYGLPEDYYSTYLQRLAAVTREDVQNAVAKYFHPENAYYFVVGDESILPALEKLDSDGKVTVLDYKGDPIEQKEISADVTVESVLDKFFTFIGGRELAAGIEDIAEEVTMEMMGMSIVSETVRIPSAGYLRIRQSMGGNVISEMKLMDGVLHVTAQGQTQQISEPAIVDPMKTGLYAFPELAVSEAGNSAELAGIESVNGKDAYKVRMNLFGTVAYFYYDTETGARVKSAVEMQGQVQESGFGDYVRTEYGISYPMLQTAVVPQIGEVAGKVTRLEINKGLKAE